jgi:capsular exopolysaccharide synthesis family protein
MNIGFKSPIALDAQPAERGPDLRTYLNFFWRHWMFIGAVTGLALLVGFVYLARATPRYTATAQILLDPQRQRIAGEANVLSDLQYDFASLESQVTIIRSDPLLRRVVIKERLAAPPPTTEKEQQNASDEDEKSAEAQRIQAAVNGLRGALGARRVPDTTAYDISVTWSDPQVAARLANAIADAYMVDQLDARLEAAKRASSWLSDRLVELRRQLRDSEDAVDTFRKENRLSPTTPNVKLNDQQLSELNGKLVAARSEMAEKKARVDFLADFIAGAKTLDNLPDSLLLGSAIPALRTKLNEISQREADLLSRYSSSYPAVVNVAAEKRDVVRSIAAEAQRMAQIIRSEYGLAKTRASAMEQAMREATGQGELDSEAGIHLRELERTAAVNKSLFEDFLQKAKITAEQSSFQARDARIVMPAQEGWQSFPDSRRVWMTAFVVGLGLGIGGAFLIELLNHGFTNPRQVEDLLGVPVLASVPRIEGMERKRGALSIAQYQAEDRLSPFSETIRMLRSGIHMLDVDQPPKVIHITSARPGEGKTTIAMSLAISAALSGLKVVLIDADLRHPSASRFFKLEQEKGLVDLLTNIATSEESMFRADTLMVIPAGSKTLNPSDVLGSERMKLLVTHLKESFDYVVLDSPPVGPVVDAIVIGSLADTSIFVAEWASTPRDLVESCVKKMSVQRRVGGIVLNRVDQRRAKKYGVEYQYGDRYYAKYYS